MAQGKTALSFEAVEPGAGRIWLCPIGRAVSVELAS
jgi:hypothetical protein